jgi:hypothetical protein
MDITATEEGKFYTLILNNEHAVNWTRNNFTINAVMTVSDSMFFMDDESQVHEYFLKALLQGLTVELNGSIMKLNHDNAVVYS